MHAHTDTQTYTYTQTYAARSYVSLSCVYACVCRVLLSIYLCVRGCLCVLSVSVSLCAWHVTLTAAVGTLGEAMVEIAWGTAPPTPAWAPLAAAWRGHPYYTYRFNLLEHIGHLSVRENGTYGGHVADNHHGNDDDDEDEDARRPPAARLRGTRGRLCYPACFAPLQYVGLMPDENFADACMGQSLSPCTPCAAARIVDGLARRQSADGHCVGVPFARILAKADAATRTGTC
jgi:hypothetical protein